MSTVQSDSTAVVVGGDNVADPTIEFDPCSNDNPEFDKETQPCQGSVMDMEAIFDGAILTTTTVAPDLTTAEMEISTSSIELPSFYSCTAAASEEEFTTQNNNDNLDTLSLSFKYEIYTASAVEDYTTVLSALERQLTNGVASSLGIDGSDCPEGDGVAIEVSVRSSATGEGGRQLMRRTIQKGKVVGSDSRMLQDTNAESLVVGLSMDPADELDSETCKLFSMGSCSSIQFVMTSHSIICWSALRLPVTCTSSAALDVPATCYPVVGAMTAWISSTEQRRLQQQVSSDDQEAALYDIIQSYIEQNQESLLTDELLHVAYIGRSDTQLASKPLQVDAQASKKVGMSAGVIGVLVATVLLAFAAFGFAIAYRRRRRGDGSREARSSLDLERGAFPVLRLEEEEEDTQNALASQESKDDNRYNSLFGLTGARSDDSSVFEHVMISPSSCTTVGAANTAAGPAQFFPTSPMNSPMKDDAAAMVGGAPPSSPTYDMAPISPMNKITGSDMAPMSPMNKTADSDDSSVLEVIDDDDSRDEVAPMPALVSGDNMIV